jgi:hypothetical protein
LTQQSTSQAQSLGAGQGGAAAQQQMLQQMMAQQGAGGMPASPDGKPNPAMPGAAGPQPPKPREVGTLTEELITRPLSDIKNELLSLFNINTLLGVNPVTDSPQDQAKKKQLHQRWQQLNQEQQQVAQEAYQLRMKQKQAEEEEKQRKAQQEQQSKQQAIAAPSSPQKGPKGPAGSQKQKAVTKLQNDRKTLGGPSGSH